MFEGLLNNLKDEIKTIRSIINISEKLREIIADNPSQLNTEDLKYLQANAPLGDKWLVNDHCSSITRLYALYENFVENLVGDWTDSWQWIENHKKVKNFIDNNSRGSVENELKNFIELRNNSAHGKEIDTVLNANELLQLCDFVEAICQAMSELVLYCFVDRKKKIGKLQKIGKVVNWYQQQQACAIKISDEPQEPNKRLEVGKKVFLVSENKKICQNAIIESIQINKNGKNTPRRRIPIREIKDSEIGLKFDKESQKGLEVYLVISE